MDHADEQSMELEALEAILGEDGLLSYIGMIPSGWDSERPIRKIKLQPDVDDLEAELSFELLFQHTTAYPETEPNIKVSNPRGLNNNEVEELLQVLLSEAAEHVGMASVFSVMQAGKEWLDTKAGLVEAVDPVVLKKQAEDALERERAAHRAHGTSVTAESFAVWKARFEADMTAADGMHSAVTKLEGGEGQTGKEWFLERERGEGADEVEALEEELADLDVEEDDEDEDEDEEDEEDFLDEYLADAGETA